MELVVAGRVRARAALLWLTATAALAALGALTAPLARDLLTGPGPDFAAALVRACAAAALVAAGVLWVTVTDVVWGVLRSGGTPPGRSTGRVGSVRRLVLAACGVTVLATTAPAHAGSSLGSGAPAGADAPLGSDAPAGARALDGLPLPDRAVGRRVGSGPTVVIVRPGDSLWTIAARRLGPGASAADVASYWRRVQALNAAVIGPDPDLIQPGQSLRLPPA
ncbi:LysM peptidoglycan-binding domain-containing protein [Nocardioides humi]|uniref:LysM domain-containing protein n=1 Tax=Nocardioides humi TaxID=449461 RepID=A0ABN1ZP73_9ACTN|nr:LysM peptidoglycan-binding domain-containing protein [Nocardioides humi]